jgi:Glycosyl transferases group 1/Glycosyltransferase Family 4
MRITAVLHRPATDPAGSEQMLKEMLLYLERCGHTVTVVVPRSGEDPPLSPVRHIFSRDVVGAAKDADVLLTHHDATQMAMRASRRLDLPIVAVLHNNAQVNKLMVRRTRGITGLIFNSEWMREDWAAIRPELPRLVVYPPVDPASYAVPQRGSLVTQINLFKNGALLWEVARLLPDTRFLAVQGGYGRQGIPTVVPSNVEVIDTTDDPVGEIYARTRILLVPSLYESWGRVGMEAASSGIPVIASTTPGLQESLSYAGLFRDPERPAHWAEAITALSNPDVYATYSEMACLRAEEVWATTQVQLEGLERFLACTASCTSRLASS